MIMRYSLQMELSQEAEPLRGKVSMQTGEPAEHERLRRDILEWPGPLISSQGAETAKP